MSQSYAQLIEDALNSHYENYQTPDKLYAPTRYMLSLGGKRIRPALVLMACESFGADPKKALNAALAIEVFHNFTLLHDDIMDAAPIRRGSATVHQKWDENTAILSGDVMMIQAYELFEKYDGSLFKSLIHTFNQAARLVCEGQQLDMDFEKTQNVSMENYLQMIKLKTAVLLGAALAIGALVAGTDKQNIRSIYDFGINLGMAYQLMDDYLDTFGSQETFGKRIGGDILESKKTFLYIHAFKHCGDRTGFDSAFETQDPEGKIEAVRELYMDSGAHNAICREIEKYTVLALNGLDAIKFSEHSKNKYKTLANELLLRKK